MSNLKEIKRKIKSVINTQKTTNAMKLVSTAKLRKAEELATKSKTFALKIDEVLSEIAGKFNQYESVYAHMPYFKQSTSAKVKDIIFITADKGLCGGFNIKTIKAVEAKINELKASGSKANLIAIGKVGAEFFRYRKYPILARHAGLSSHPDFLKAKEIINARTKEYIAGKTDGIILVHNGYKNMISQELKLENILPLAQIKPSKDQLSALELEPEDGVIEDLVESYLEYNLYFALIDSLAAEHSARMQAMDTATNNASERIKELNLKYNKARQESITTELIEIISGVESMK